MRFMYDLDSEHCKHTAHEICKGFLGNKVFIVQKHEPVQAYGDIVLVLLLLALCRCK